MIERITALSPKGIRYTERAADLIVGICRSDREPTTWVSISDDRGVGLEMTLESARRVLRALRATLLAADAATCRDHDESPPR